MKSVTRRAALAALAAASLAAGPALAQDLVLKVGAYPTNPPWQFKNEKGEFEGFEVDMVREIAKRLNAKVEIQDLGFQALFAATSSKRIDMAISSITITKERLKSQAFTQAHYDSDMALATRGDSTLKLTDLKGKMLGGLATSTGEKWIKENGERLGIAGSKSYDTQQNLLLDLQAGRIDGVISDLAGMQVTFQKMTALKIAELIKTGDQYGIMMPKDSPHLAKVNEAISAMKKDGTLAAIHKKWLGSDAAGDSSSAQERPLPKE
jgi:polar amino acid transport system substrate-binding protein